jgi:hypothetical protein
MKILLLITTCNLNKQRILNQIKNLEKHKQLLDSLNIHPKFLTADADLVIENYPVIRLTNFKDEYTNLAKKTIYGIEYVMLNEEFDYLIKMDDDTLFNVDCLTLDYFNSDYTGKFFETFAKNEITINLPAYGIRDEPIRLYPHDYLNTAFSFAAGNFYILSKKAAQIIVSNKLVLDKFYAECVHVSEDQLVGYLLRDPCISKQDIGYKTIETEVKRIQLTNNLVTLHPVPTSLYCSLLSKSPNDQLQALMNSNILYFGREKITEQIKTTIKKTVFELLNLKRMFGMG